MNEDERLSVYEQLESLQQKDWKELSLNDKKAGTLILFSMESGDAHLRLLSFSPGIGSLTVFFSSCSAYYVAFGPHGPRAPTSQPGDGVKILFSTLGLIGAAGLLFYGVLLNSAYFYLARF